MLTIINYIHIHTYTHTYTHVQPLKSGDISNLVPEWYSNFVSIDQEMLFELILAANYMEIHQLIDLTCATVTTMIRGKSNEEIRNTFNLTVEFTPEQEKEIRDANKWCEEN